MASSSGTATDLFGLVVVGQAGQGGAGALGEQTGTGVDAQLVAGVDDVEVAHGELADAVGRRERRVLDLLHAQALGLVGQVGRHRVQDRVVVAAPQLDRDLARHGARHPALGRLAQHDGLRVEPAALVEQPSELAAAVAVLLDRVLVVDAGDQALVGDEQQRQAGSLVDAAALGLDDAVLDLVAHAQAMAPADAVGLQDQRDEVGVFGAVQGDRTAFLEAHGDGLALDRHVVLPEGDAHDRIDDLHAGGEILQVLGLVRGAQHVGVGRVGLLGRHLVAEAGRRHERRHLGATAQLVDEQLVEPGLVDLQRRVGEQAIAVEALDVVALEGAAVAPDVDVVLLHGRDQHGAGHGAAERGGVEVGHARGGDVEGAGLQRGEAFGGELAAAVDQPGALGAVLHGLARDLFVVGLVGLAEVGGVGIGDRALLLHPVQRGAGVQAPGEGDADLLAGGYVLQDRRHANGTPDSAEMADVAVGLARDADLERGITGHAELVAGAGADPFGAAREQVLAAARRAFHDLGRAGVEGEGGRQDHADRFLAAVGERQAVADALAVEIHVGLRGDGRAGQGFVDRHSRVPGRGARSRFRRKESMFRTSASVRWREDVEGAEF